MEILKKYPGIRLATKEDSDRLLDFFASSPMDSDKLKLSYKREPDFFKFLSYQSDEPFIFCAENENGQLTGVASLNVREGLINGEVKRIGYMADLRSKRELQSKDFTKIWKDCLADVISNIKTIPELRCDYLITVIIAGNKKAQRSLVNRSENDFHYEKICRYEMVNIISTLGKLKEPMKYKAYRCDNKEEILDYIGKHHMKKHFGFTHSYIKRAFLLWDGLKIDSFIKVENEKKEIVGMCATWNPSPVKKIIIEKLPLKLKILNFIASTFTKSSSEGGELKIQYLNFMVWDDAHFFPSVINLLRAENTFNHFDMVSYADYEMNSLKKLLGRSIVNSTAIEMYQVVSKESMEDLLTLDEIPGFEMSLV